MARNNDMRDQIETTRKVYSGWTGWFLLCFLGAAAAGGGVAASGSGGGATHHTNPPAHQNQTTGRSSTGGTSGGSNSGGGTVVESVNVYSKPNYINVKTGDNYDMVKVSHQMALYCQHHKHYSYKSKSCY